MEETSTPNVIVRQKTARTESSSPFATVDTKNVRVLADSECVIVIASVSPVNLAADMEYRGAPSPGSNGIDLRGLLDSYRARSRTTPCNMVNISFIPAYFEDLFEEEDGVYRYTNAKGAVFPNQAISYDHLWGFPPNRADILLEENYMVLAANFLDMIGGGRFRGIAVTDGVPTTFSVDICALMDFEGLGTMPFLLWRGFTGLQNPVPRSSPAIYSSIRLSALPGNVLDAFHALASELTLSDRVVHRCASVTLENKSSAEMTLYANYADPRLRKLQLRGVGGGPQTPLIRWIGEAFSFDICRAKLRFVEGQRWVVHHPYDFSQDLVLDDLSLVPQVEPMCKAIKSYMNRKWSMDVALWLDAKGDSNNAPTKSSSLPKPSAFSIAANRLRSVIASNKSDADMLSLMRFEDKNPIAARANRELANRRAVASARRVPGDSGGLLMSENEIEMERLPSKDRDVSSAEDHSLIEGYEHGRHVNVENVVDCESIVGVSLGAAKGELINRLLHSPYPTPTYKVQSSGPPHAPTFVATAQMEGPRRCIGHGCGKSKTQAENMAALSLLAARPFRGIESMGPSTAMKFEKLYRERYGTTPYILYDVAEGGATATLEFDGSLLVGVGEDNYSAYLDLAEGIVDRFGDVPYTEIEGAAAQAHPYDL